MKMQPIGNRVVAKQIDLSQQTASGILLQNTVGKTSNVGEVTHVGPNATNCKVGDKVIYIDNMTFNFMGEQYVTFLDTQILAILS